MPSNITNAQLAQKISNLIDFFNAREEEFRAWLAGVPGGGPAGDGKFPLTDLEGTTRYTTAPAQLEADVHGLVDSASAYSDSAGDSAAEAAASATAAAAKEALALTHRNAALASQNAAEDAQSAAENAAVNAQAHRTAARQARDKAQQWASEDEDVEVEPEKFSALHYAVKAAVDAASAGTSEANAATSAADAAASAAAAATFDPANLDSFGVPDTRDVNDLPGSFGAKFRVDFKAKSTIGLPSEAYSSYAGLLTFSPWTGSTSSITDHQIAFSGHVTGPDGLFWRTGYDGVWEGWKQLITTGFEGDANLGSNAILSFGSSAGVKQYLYSSTFGFGIESGTLYAFSSGAARFRWYSGNPTEAGATVSMALTPSLLHLGGKNAFRFNDNWLRLNQDQEFTSGVYTPGHVRIDGDVILRGAVRSTPPPNPVQGTVWFDVS